MQKQKILPATYDFVFKYVFSSEPNADILKDFLSVHLDFAADELEEIVIKNPFLLRGYQEDKEGILDIKCVTKSRKVIDVEIQVELKESLEYRIEYYESKMITEQIGRREEYDALHPVITLLILTENRYKDKIYHHRFYNYDPVAQVRFSDLKEIHVLELSKLSYIEKDSMEYKWGQLITASEEEEMDSIAEYGPTFEKAVESIKYCSEDERLRLRAESRRKFLADQAVNERAAKRAQERAEKRMEEAERRSEEAEKKLEESEKEFEKELSDRNTKLAEYERRFGKLD